VPVYTPRPGEYGHVARLARVNALRALEGAGVIVYDEYVSGTPPEFVIRNAQGEERRPTGREVPVYLLGAADLMLALDRDMLDVINEAFARPSVTDRESLAEAILDVMDTRFGAAVRRAAEGSHATGREPAMAAAS